MKNKIIASIAVIIFIIGFLVLNYPVISTVYNQYRQNQLMTHYDSAVTKMDQPDLEAYERQAKEYNTTLAQSDPSFSDAFSQKDEKEDSSYTQVLDLDESGIMGSIEIPGIHVYLPIYHGTSVSVLEKGIGHLEGSSFPVGGESTHAILTGHRGLPSAELFSDLDQVTEGDVFYIHILNKTLAYQVYGTEVVKPEEIENLKIEEGRDLVTLVTCTPYGVNSHRLLIHAERTTYVAPEKATDTKQAVQQNLWKWLLTQKAFLVTCGLMILMLIYGIVRLIRHFKA